MRIVYSTIFIFTLAANAWAGLEGVSNTKYGQGSGSAAGDNDFGVFIGRNAGLSNTSGSGSTFLGTDSGYTNTTGNYNTFVGGFAGYSNIGDSYNTFLGYAAGFGTTGSGNVFLGYGTGANGLVSNRLYIDNSATATPLIYGEFDNRRVALYGNLEVIGPDNGLVRLTDVTTDLTTKAARMVLNHYDNMQYPVYLFGAASTPTQNFVAFGGGNVIGNAATQLDFFTAANNTTTLGTARMTINGSGNVGMGVTSPIYPLQMASGALVTEGGVWTNASSREYKENIQSLSTTDAALTLARLNPVTYNYKVDKNQAHVGFIAEDVPELVATKDRKGLSPMDIVAVLTKVTQEQQRAIGEHEKMMQAQQKIIAELKEQNKLIPILSTALSELKHEVRMGRTTALAD